MDKQIVDVCCGSKMFWHNKLDERVLFCDIRKEDHILCDGRKLTIKPDLICDFKSLPFLDNSFWQVVFDPPHLLRAGENSWLRKKYGKLNDNWRDEIRKGFSEAFRVLKFGGTLIFKWNETQITTSEILQLTKEKPTIKQRVGKNDKTHWILFLKQAEPEDWC